ncbi:MAG: hypothetical protein N3G77_05825 [Nitrososphaeria archaeon]|nr:hypothetical protein [Nitrososphaeria archaeon]
MKSRLFTIILMLLIMFLGVISTSSGVDKRIFQDVRETITETVYTYTGVPITLTSTKIVKEYVTFLETVTEFSTLFKTEGITLFKTTTVISTEVITMTVYTYLPIEVYSSILVIMLLTLLVLILILVRIGKSRPKEEIIHGYD